MTYQRNMGSGGSLRFVFELEDGVDDGLPDGVHEAEVAAGEDDEAEHDGRGLEDVAAIRPLHAAQLVDAAGAGR